MYLKVQSTLMFFRKCHFCAGKQWNLQASVCVCVLARFLLKGNLLSSPPISCALEEKRVVPIGGVGTTGRRCFNSMSDWISLCVASPWHTPATCPLPTTLHMCPRLELITSAANHALITITLHLGDVGRSQASGSQDGRSGAANKASLHTHMCVCNGLILGFGSSSCSGEPQRLTGVQKRCRTAHQQLEKTYKRLVCLSPSASPWSCAKTWEIF